MIRFGTLTASKDFLTERLQVMVVYFPMTMVKFPPPNITIHREYKTANKSTNKRRNIQDLTRIYINVETTIKKRFLATIAAKKKNKS